MTHVTAAAAPGANGMDDHDVIYTGPNQLLSLPQGSEIKVVPMVDPDSIAALSSALAEKEQQMVRMGAAFASDATASVNPDAARAADRTAQSLLPLLSDALDSCLTASVRHLLAWRAPGVSLDGVAAKTNRHYLSERLTARDLRVLQTSFERGYLPLTILHQTLQRIGVVPQSMDSREFVALLGREDETPVSAESKLMLYADPESTLDALAA